jgi:hypothetical protein
MWGQWDHVGYMHCLHGNSHLPVSARGSRTPRTTSLSPQQRKSNVRIRNRRKLASCRIEQETAHKPAPNDLLIRGLATFYGSGSEATLQEALQLFEQALELDPASIPARVAVAHALCVNIACGWSNSVQEDKARAEGMLLPAIERDTNNVRARMALGLLRRLQLGCELGVRYVLEGSLRWTGDLARVNVQLTDAESGAHLWANRLDTDRGDLPAARDEIIGRLARTLNIKLMAEPIGQRAG